MANDSDAAPDLGVPATLGPYRVGARLGGGGMGVVYRAEHPGTGEQVALKTVRLADQAMLSSLRREIHALRRIDHPGVVRIVAEGVDEGLPWYAMELLLGRTLHDHNTRHWRRVTTGVLTTTMEASPESATAELPDSGPVSARVARFAGAATVAAEPGPPALAAHPAAAGGSLPETLTLLRGVCETLAFVHGMGLVHRDLKPDNVFIRDDGTPVLVDFGLALAASGATGKDKLEVSGRPMGSPAYMSPEQIRGELADARADLYALGCMLYEGITGRVPFEGTVQMVISQHLHKRPQPPSELVEGVPPALERLVLTLLQKRPQDRLGYADDVAAALAALGAAGRPGWPRGRSYLYRPSLAGRSVVLSDVEKSLEGAQQHRGARVFVGGESGVGKTRFAMEIATLATRRGLRVVTGECAAVSAGEDRALRAAPLHPFRPLLLALADRCRELGPEETARLLGDRGPVLAAYEPSLLRLPGQEALPELASLQAQAARARLVSALTETLAALAAAEPLLLLIDDLQWADENSLAVLRALDEAWFERSPVVLLGTYRTEENNDAIRELTQARGAVSVELGRLDAAAVGRMVSDMLAMPAPPAEFIDFLVEQSEGNPFFIAEYLRVAIDERVLARNEEGDWRVTAEGAARDTFRDALPLPRELRALVGRRVAALGTGARALARVASVLGREFDADVLVAATTLDEIPGLEAIEELRARQILDVVGGRLRFAHDKLREIIFAEIPDAQSRALSGVAARAIEARYAGTPEIAGCYPILAHHFAVSGDDEKAIEYLEKAGGRALETGASSEAVGFLRRALDLDDQRRRRGDEPAPALRRACWERRLGQAEFNLGNMRDAERLTAGALHRLRSGHAPADALRKPPTAIAFVVLVAHLLRQFYHLFGPARRPTADPETRRRVAEASLAAERLSEIYFFQSEPLLSFSAALESANLAEALGPSPVLARSYATLSVAFGLVPWQRVVDAYEARARAAAAESADAEAISWVHFLIGLSAIGNARWEDARRALDHAREIARAVQDHRRVEECLALRGNIEVMTGSVEGALASYAELFASAKKSGNQQGEAWALCGRSECYLTLGRPAEALDNLERAHLLMKEDSGDESERITRGEAALVYLMRDDRPRARRIAADTLALMNRLSPSAFHVIYGYVTTCEVLCALYEDERGPEERAALGRSVQLACRALRGYARIFPIGRPYADRFDGVRLALAGKATRAQRLFARSRAAAERLGMPLEAAIASYEMGRFLPPDDARRAEHLEQARAVFAAQDARFWLTRVDAARAGQPQPSA